MNAPQSLSAIFYSIQRALLGNVTPNLRAVYVIVNTECYHLFFYYDQPLSEEEEELASLVDTEFIADFPSVDSEDRTCCTIEVIAYPQPIINKGQCLYERYEPKIGKA